MNQILTENEMMEKENKELKAQIQQIMGQNQFLNQKVKLIEA